MCPAKLRLPVSSPLAAKVEPAGVSAWKLYVAGSDGTSLLGKIRWAPFGWAAVIEPEGVANHAVATTLLRSFASSGLSSRGPDE